MELGLEELKRVERVFERCIMTNPNVGLWSSYINYTRRIHNMDTEPEKSRAVINQVYDFVLENIGIDINSGRIWLDYIEFLRSSLPGVVGGTDWRDMQKMDTLRKVYQKAIAVPTNATLDIWREYDKFELHLNKATVRYSFPFLLRIHDSKTFPGPQASARALTILRDCTQCQQHA
jgi:cleavage stimulation factor subunit 3